MSSPVKLGLFIFRRDLRIEDNTALREAFRQCEKVLPCFIFDPRQVDDNPYKSKQAIQFMLESLNELAGKLRAHKGRLFYFYGIAEEVVEELLKTLKIYAVFINRDYTPFSRERDSQIEEVCSRHEVRFSAYSDTLLCEIGTVLTGKGTPYAVFSAFAQKVKAQAVPEPEKTRLGMFYTETLEQEVPKIAEQVLPGSDFNDQLFTHGGRSRALAILQRITEFRQYKETRDFPGLAATTGLSPHNKFGTVSIREVYHRISSEFGSEHELIRQLYWRDFFTHVAYHYPHVFGHAFHRRYDKIPWSRSNKAFRAWCEGETGFPIVDAAMRQLNATGYMPNRLRMIVASFLVKDLHLDWRRGERYFAQTLIDYDPAVNNGNWQWAASTGCDAQPYFRIINPWLQQKKFDPDCKYIKQWVPELRSLSAKDVHNLKNTKGNLFYPPPIVDHRDAADAAEEMFQNLN